MFPRIHTGEAKSRRSDEERTWNRLSESMSSFHEWFKSEFDTLYELADGSFNNCGMSLSMYIRSAESFHSHLTVHHTIEERHVFPFLATRMKQFSKDADAGHVASHKGIHDGLDNLMALIKKFKSEPNTYSPTEMRACLDGFRDVLFSHLDEEVSDLRGENLKKYFTLEEVETLLQPFGA